MTTAPLNKPSDYLPYTGRNQWWTADPDGLHILQDAQTGAASYTQGTPLLTIPQILARAAEVNGTKNALSTENAAPLAKGEKPPPGLSLKQWKTWTWKNYYDDVKKFACACISVGMQPHDSVNIFGFNSPEWSISLLGAIFAGGKGAGIYPSDSEDQVKFKSDHSNGVVAAVQSLAELEKFRKVAKDLPVLRAIVTWECEPGEDIILGDRIIRVFSWTDFLALGEKAGLGGELERRLVNIKPGNACVLVYTSGTTGKPKAVMVCHDTLHYSVTTVVKETKVLGVTKGEERVVSYLPLSHVAGMMVDVMVPLITTANYQFKGSFCTFFARSYDLKFGTLVERLKTVRPTVFLGVPRVWEKIMEKLMAVGASSGAMTKALSAYAKKRGALHQSSRQLGLEKKTPTTMAVANLILNKIKVKLGLDKAKFMFSGAAPMPREVLEYFGSLGINVNEVYGMSETTGVGTWSTETHHVWGSVGYEVAGAEVKILRKEDGFKEAPACQDLFHPTEEEQGEICFRGRYVMMGYMANPRLGKEHVAEIELKNAEAIDEHGWLHSGDKGTRDKRGMFKITGRYKELIIGAGGENIAPVPIEDELKKICPIISNCIMIGNKKKFNVILVTLKTAGANGELPGSFKLDGPAKTLSNSKTLQEAVEDPVFIKTITDAIKKVNKNPEVVPSNAAVIQKFSILPRDFSIQTGELTATLKIKRSFVEDEFDPIITRMYFEDSEYVNYKLAPTLKLDMGSVGGPEEKPMFERAVSFNMVNTVEEVAEMDETAVAEASKETHEEI